MTERAHCYFIFYSRIAEEKSGHVSLVQQVSAGFVGYIPGRRVTAVVMEFLLIHRHADCTIARPSHDRSMYTDK